MKSTLKILSILLFTSCVAPKMQTYEYTTDMTGEKTFKIVVDTYGEATRIQKRYERRGEKVIRIGRQLILTPEQVELRRRILKQRGYIKEKYRIQIESQL